MLPVYVQDRLIGEVHDECDGPRFAYRKDWITDPAAFPLSVTMPLGDGTISPDRFLVWAANLLPEGEQLVAIGRRLDIAPTNVLGLLEAIGRDTAGAFSFGAPGRSDTASWQPIESDADLERLIDTLPAHPFLVGTDGVSMALAGAQTKLAVARDGAGRLHIPHGGAPSTHILKPGSARLPGSVQNEAYCLSLAKRCGLAVPAITTGTAGRHSWLLIARYDRQPDGTDWRRLHQEDFCQVLGRPPTAKYEHSRKGVDGPTLAEMIAAVRRHALAPDILAILDAAVFNILTSNTDAHAKNYALLLPADGIPRLAPLYDVMCAAPYEGVTRSLAHMIAGVSRGEDLTRRHWIEFVKGAGLGRPALRRIGGLARTALAQVHAAREDVEAMPAGGDATLPIIVDAVSRRCEAILAGLQDKEEAD